MSTQNRKKNCSSGVGERLRIIRKKLGITQAEAAKNAGVSVQSWREYEAERAEPKISSIAFLVERNISISWLITGNGSIYGLTEDKRVESEIFRGTLAEWIKEQSEGGPNFYADFSAECAAFFPDYAEWLKKRKAHKD